MFENLVGLPPELATEIAVAELSDAGIVPLDAHPTSDTGVYAHAVGFLNVGGERNQAVGFCRLADGWEARSAVPVSGPITRSLLVRHLREMETVRPGDGDWTEYESSRWTFKSPAALAAFVTALCGVERPQSSVGEMGVGVLVEFGLVDGFSSSDEARFLEWRQQTEFVTVSEWLDGTRISFVDVGGESLPVLEFASDDDGWSYFRPVSCRADVEDLASSLLALHRRVGDSVQVRRVTGYLTGHCPKRPGVPFLSGHRLAVEMAHASTPATRAA